MIIREVAHYDYDRIRIVMRWPLRDLFLAYLAQLKDDARRAYEIDVQIWATLAPHQKQAKKAPDVPKILR